MAPDLTRTIRDLAFRRTLIDRRFALADLRAISRPPSVQFIMAPADLQPQEKAGFVYRVVAHQKQSLCQLNGGSPNQGRFMRPSWGFR